VLSDVLEDLIQVRLKRHELWPLNLLLIKIKDFKFVYGKTVIFSPSHEIHLSRSTNILQTSVLYCTKDLYSYKI
jgi:hypothetical protein